MGNILVNYYFFLISWLKANPAFSKLILKANLPSKSEYLSSRRQLTLHFDIQHEVSLPLLPISNNEVRVKVRVI